MVRIISRNIGNYQSTLLNIPEQRRSRGQKIWDTCAYKNYSDIKMQLIKYKFANSIHLAQERSTVMNLWVLVKGENSAPCSHVRQSLQNKRLRIPFIK